MSVKKKKPPVSPTQSASRKQMSGLMTAFKALSMKTKGSWQNAANLLNAKQKRTGRGILSPANVYVMVNSGRRAAGLSDLQTAPSDLSLPKEFPNVQVVSQTGGASFSLALQSAGCANHVEISAANGVPAGKQSVTLSSLKVLTVTSGLESPLLDITNVYRHVFGPQEEGAQIAVRLVAITASGIRGVPYDVAGIVGATSAQAAQTDPDVELNAA